MALALALPAWLLPGNNERRRTVRLVDRWRPAADGGPPTLASLGREGALGWLIDPDAGAIVAGPELGPFAALAPRLIEMARVAVAIAEPVGLEGWELGSRDGFFRAALLPVRAQDGAMRVLATAGVTRSAG